MKKINKKAFTLIELLVVIAIIGLISTTATIALSGARKKARDARRLSDMKQIMTALESYYDSNSRYPDSDFDGCGGWDVGNLTYPLLTNRLTGIMDPAPVDPLIKNDSCLGYRYFRYGTSYGCTRPFYVLGVTDMETSGRPHPDSHGWSCPTRNWQNEMDWVTGSFE